MVDQEILAYYECNDERGRLAAGRQRIEFLRVWELLERFPPSPPAAVLDVGGAAGRYSVPLAAAGYEVRLVDPVPVLVAQAEQAAREAGVPLAAEAGDARSLPAADDSADAVLLFGPLYHLTDSADRVTALPEARRDPARRDRHGHRAAAVLPAVREPGGGRLILGGGQCALPRRGPVP
jgi:SAM-dependent methyltransferase